MTTYTLPTVLAFDRKLEPSDAQMFSGNWDDIENNGKWEPIVLFERRNRAVKSNFKQEVLDDEEELKKQVAEANLAWGDDASLLPKNDTLKVSFTLRVLSGVEVPSACNNSDFESRYRKKISEYFENGFDELASRYAYNIVNGRFLWRNRVSAQNIKIIVSHSSLSDPLIFNAYDYSLKSTTSSKEELKSLTHIFKLGLSGKENILISVNAFVQLGEAQRVWPSQEMVLNSPKGEKSRHLFSLNGCAAIHCEKIGNAIRTIDDWYQDDVAPIAIEAYGSVTQRGVAYRSSKNDFKTLLLEWLNSDGGMTENDMHFVVAMLIRGGVFGEGES